MKKPVLYLGLLLLLGLLAFGISGKVLQAKSKSPVLIACCEDIMPDRSN